MKRNADIGLSTVPSKLFDANFPDLQQVGLAFKDFFNAVLLQGGHAILEGLVAYVFHLGTPLNQLLHFVSARQKLVDAHSSPVSRIVA